jgi:hypothetical protein
MPAEMGLTAELVEEVRRELAQRERSRELKRDLAIVIENIDEAWWDISDAESEVLSIEVRLKRVLRFLKSGDVRKAVEEVERSREKAKEARSALVRALLFVEGASDYIEAKYFRRSGNDC